MGPGGWQPVEWPHLGIEDAWLDEAWALHRAARVQHLAGVVDWSRVSGKALGATLLLFERREDGRLRDYAVVELGREQVDVQGGPRLLLRRRFTALRITGGVVSAEGAAPAAALADLLAMLRRLYPRLAIHLLALPPSVLPDLQAAGVIKGMHVLAQGRQPHYRLAIPANADDLFASLDARMRSGYRRHLRRLERQCGVGRVQLQAFSRPDEVNGFLDAALPVARESYQYQLLRGGLAANERRHEWLLAIAQAGWWRGHVLWCGDEPVAFLISARVGTTQYGLEMGYDSNWAEWSVGTVAVLEFISALVADHDPPATLDFLYGGQAWKRRLSTHQRDEESAYLFPATVAGVSNHLLLRGGRRMTGMVGRQLHRFGLRDKVTNYLRDPVLPPPAYDPDGPG